MSPSGRKPLPPRQEAVIGGRGTRDADLTAGYKRSANSMLRERL